MGQDRAMDSKCGASPRGAQHALVLNHHPHPSARLEQVNPRRHPMLPVTEQCVPMQPVGSPPTSHAKDQPTKAPVRVQ